jgi:hypothetical protein
MTKGELRAARKRARAEGKPWTVEKSDSGQLEIVHERTPQEEARHARQMDKLARAVYEQDRDF